ncbi:MAG: potassium transporter Kup [Sphingomonadaceae bacterium]|uniref:potassium transporter Kup n=1 Tax=Thermaurantiacus sp. TaxID=2820283 RepID=UPI00298ED666|nr:potassium transporter Kup [Thermaurantiacus sp.]MCS6986481.1 potassium transporter Kup [Sphingomonadaceae bacterium]MDW8414258.1 potassium transporter Kup [Thermaurantiacus sp.]
MNDTARQAVRTRPPQADSLARLMLGALGVVFGDIGTSPLYALRETFVGHHPLPVDRFHVFGVISLVFWTLILIVTVKYIGVILRADNRGEGGAIALQALLMRHGAGARWLPVVVVLGVLATSLFVGESIITPAISVLSAVEGLVVVEARLEPLVLPLAVLILVGLFVLQARGTARVGALFGPVTLFYFLTIATLGAFSIAASPGILGALSPHHAVRFFLNDGVFAFLAMSSVFLVVTGAEALYADMGHFGRRPIALSWLLIVFPALMLNYLGQGALLLRDPETIRNPFFLLAPEVLRLPLVVLATLATIIASQAVISGAFSITRQAVQLGFLPRLRIRHTSERTEGQIYIPFVNWGLLALVVLLVLSFGSSSNLAAAYGISVAGTMTIVTLMTGIVMFRVWKWNRWLAGSLIAVFLAVDFSYLAANFTKIPEGGWFPLVVGIVSFTLLTTWARGRDLMQQRMKETAMPIEIFIKSAARTATRVPGTAVFMTSTPTGVPPALLHNLKHNKVLHERVLILTVVIEDVPYVDEEDRIEVIDLGENFFRMILRYGFMQQPDVPAALRQVETCGPAIRMMDTSFFLARQTLLPSARPGMALWREKIFAWMLRNAESAMEFFKLPTNRVVELGSQVEI